jgi:fructose-bisphosphate aldolase class II
LGRIGTADFIETDTDEELYTDPQEAAYFVQQTGIDALAVSVGTAHGVYKVRQPKIDLERLKAIRLLTPVLLVLHGGSGTPIDMIQNAIRLEGGGVSKVNIATDLELALLGSLGLKERATDAALRTIPPEALDLGSQAVQQVVEEKIVHFLTSNNHASDYPI